MYCVNCGHELPDNAKFCSSCGQNPHGEPATQAASDKTQSSAKQSKKSDTKPVQTSKASAAKQASPLRWIIPLLLIAAAAAYVFLVVLPNQTPPDPALVNASIQQTVDAIASEESPAPSATVEVPPATEEPALAASPTSEPEPTEAGPEQIAFASDRAGSTQIWIINQDGSGLEQLTNQSGGACQPSWAPDGSAFAYTSPCVSNRISYPGAAIYIYEMESAQSRQLTEGEDGDYDPAWSPMGDHIAFTTLRVGRSQIFYYFLNNEESISQSSSALFEYQPSWSPDASQMAYVTTALGDELVFYFNLLDGERRQLLTVGQSDEKFVSSPRFAPDAQGVFYNLTPRSGGFSELYFVPMPGNPTQHQALFNEAIPGRDISFSPDGNWAAFESWPNTSNHDIWVATSAGQDRSRLTTDSANDFDAAWRP